MPKVSQFSSAYAKTSAPPVELMAILSNIKSGKWQKQVEDLRNLSGKAYDEAKKKLIGFTVTGVFERRNDESFVEHSGFVQVDVDAKDNPNLTYEKMWKRVKECPHTYAAFRSPSGRGIKVIVKCPADRDSHAGSYKAAAQWFMDKGVKVDTQVCALSQLCFVSFDPHLFVNSKPKQVVPLAVEREDHALIEYEETRSKEEILAACEAASPDMFRDLWEGDYQLHTEDHSYADHILICLLRDNCHSNEMVAELFAESGLYRPDKWKGRTRDYVFQTLRKSTAVANLSLLNLIPEDPADPSPPKKKKSNGWSWEFIGDIPEWTAEDDKYIVKRLLHEGTVTCVYGPPGSGKTFVVFDLCAAIASGKPWRGFKVRQGGVAYFGLEGRQGVKKRLQAMRAEGRLKNEDPFASVLCGSDSLNLLEGGHVDRCVEMVKAMEAEKGHRIKVIVIDTLAKSTPGGDENSTKDMGQVLIHAQQIADKTGCCVLVIHHSGKDTSRGMRGSTALPGGFDSVFRVSRHEDDNTVRVWHIEKQRDESDTGDMYFKLDVFSLGFDLDGEQVTTCLVRFLDDAEIPIKKEKGQMESDHLLSLIPEDGITFTDLLKSTGLGRSTLQRRLAMLVNDFSLKKDDRGLYTKIFEDLSPDDNDDPTKDL